MKVLIFYRPNSDHATMVEAFVRDFQHQHDLGNKVELVSIDTREGAATASLYDIWDFPTVMVVGNDGRMLNMWQGKPMPLMDEVAGYVYS
ncbi:MAG TPA: hypothetical protein VFM05_10475 [Candidatus Saccharimonadales bacterium]|nr:hypothetical protein [Candidatus Saccharimonadales bacterium]